MCPKRSAIFFQQHLTLNGINNANLHVLRAELLDTMAITELGFPENLNRCMHNNGIYTICDLQKIKLTQLYDIIPLLYRKLSSFIVKCCQITEKSALSAVEILKIALLREISKIVNLKKFGRNMVESQRFKSW